MNLDTLRDELRAFVAARGWEPFHDPKNLSTALMVEAAELAEIFQWMTREQSLAVRTDAGLRERTSATSSAVRSRSISSATGFWFEWRPPPAITRSPRRTASPIIRRPLPGLRGRECRTTRRTGRRKE